MIFMKKTDIFTLIIEFFIILLLLGSCVSQKMCISDADCDDGNECTDDTCVSRQCFNECNAMNPEDPCCTDNACTVYSICNMLTIKEEVIIEAEEMDYHANGEQIGEYWRLLTNGTMSEDLYFPDSRVYRFEIIAKGSLVDSTGPEMDLIIDGEVMDSAFVNTSLPEAFVFNIGMSKGIHKLAIGFYNDFYNPSSEFDRNLYVDKMIIHLSSVPNVIEQNVFEAEEMSYHSNGGQTGDYWLLLSNGTMSEQIYFPDIGIYSFEIIAKGTLIDNVGPEMELIIDGEVIDSVFVNTTLPETFVFDLQITTGTHEIAIGFHNFFNDSSTGLERNLCIDKTTINQIDNKLIVIEAEDMDYHANGEQRGKYWLLWANGTMNKEIYFPDKGVYRFEIIAKGTLVDNIGPEMELIIDGEVMESNFVNTITPEVFVFDIKISERSHQFAIGFYNDFYDPLAGLDRNLYVDKTIVRSTS